MTTFDNESPHDDSESPANDHEHIVDGADSRDLEGLTARVGSTRDDDDRSGMSHDAHVPAPNDVERTRDVLRLRALFVRTAQVGEVTERPEDSTADQSVVAESSPLPTDEASSATADPRAHQLDERALLSTSNASDNEPWSLDERALLSTIKESDNEPWSSDDRALLSTSKESDNEPWSSDERALLSTSSASGDEPRSHDPMSTSLLQFPLADELADLERPMPSMTRRSKGRRVAVASLAIAFVVTVGLYAGGGTYIAELLDNRADERALMSVPVLAPVLLDSAGSAADSIAYADQLTSFGERPEDTVRRASSGTARRPMAVQPVGAMIGQAIPKAALNRYAVQVRATPDRMEANRLAARLRSRGAQDVAVSAAIVDGAELYRVRYGSFETPEAARLSGRRNGHADSWAIAR